MLSGDLSLTIEVAPGPAVQWSDLGGEDLVRESSPCCVGGLRAWGPGPLASPHPLAIAVSIEIPAENL